MAWVLQEPGNILLQLNSLACIMKHALEFKVLGETLSANLPLYLN